MRMSGGSTEAAAVTSKSHRGISSGTLKPQHTGCCIKALRCERNTTVAAYSRINSIALAKPAGSRAVGSSFRYAYCMLSKLQRFTHVPSPDRGRLHRYMS